MKKNSIILIALLITGAFLFATPLAAQEKKENKKLEIGLLYGKWKAINANAYNAPSIEELKQAANPSDTSKAAMSGAKKGGGNSPQMALRMRMNLENIAINEAKSTMELLPNKTAVKISGGKTFNATWKLKKTSIIAKDLKTKEKFRMDIVKWGDNDIQVIETFKAGQVFVTYTRDK